MAVQAPGYTQIPNDFLDEWMNKLTGVEFKILMSICRKTFGWHKDRDKISLSQFEEITGAGKSNIVEAIKKLEGLDLITPKRRDHKTTSYAVKVVSKTDKTSPEIGQDDGLSCPVLGHTKESSKETPKRKASPAVKNKLNGIRNEMIKEIIKGNEELGLKYEFVGKEIGMCNNVLKTLESLTDDPAEARMIFFDKASAAFNKLETSKWHIENKTGYTFTFIYNKWNDLRLEEQ